MIIDTHLCSWRNAELALSPGDPCPLITDSVGCEGPWVGGSSGAVEEAGSRHVSELHYYRASEGGALCLVVLEAVLRYKSQRPLTSAHNGSS